ETRLPERGPRDGEAAQGRAVIRLLVLDVDGVLTNGEISLDETGAERKSLFLRDVDAVFAARREGLELALLSGEQTALVGVIARRLEIDTVVAGRKDKEEALRELAASRGVPLHEVCYVADAVRDAGAL